ncbi:MAG TPA: hypothetical protein VGM86_16560 [Thermoanaerobaculia bacterium]
MSTSAQTFTLESARSLPITGALCGVIAVETAALHLLLMFRHPWLAWTLTALSLWTIVWLIGDYRAIGARPVVLAKGSPGYLKLSGPGSPNVLLTFVRPVEFTGPAGIRKSFTRVGLRLDQPAEFLRALEAVRSGAT